MKENKNSYKREFIRDGRAPIPEKEITSEIMSSIRAKNTKPEIILRKTLYDTGLSGYRLHWKKAPGRPDICYPGKKIAIFVNGCFWHRCPHCNPPMPKTHTHFWENKFAKNIERDKKKIKDLEKEDWKVLVFWECQINENAIKCVNEVKKTLKSLNQMRVIDLFCGAGGFSEGFRQAGFSIIWAVDNWQGAVDTHSENHPDSKTIKEDVVKLSLLPDEEFHKVIPDSEVILGSPPCVAFSNSNKSGKGDKSRGVDLIEGFLRIIARKKFKKGSILKYWILENVPNVQQYIKDRYTVKELGIKGDFVLCVKDTNSGIYNAKFFGVPSNRKRYFCGEFPSPEPIFKSEKSLIPLKKVLSDLGNPKENLEKLIKDPNYNFSLISKEITDHHYILELADFEWQKAKRLKQDKGYMGKMSFPENLEKPSRTIMATMSFSSRESFILGYKNQCYRSPTTREVASLMSFPIDYRFYGNSLSNKYKLVGNAVPPKLAYAFAKAIAKKEDIRSKDKYKPIKYMDAIDFTNLNFDTFHIKKEKPKRPTARFKYHIPYLIVETYRVELTNYHSDFDNLNFKWDVEIHKSQGHRARIFTPNKKGFKLTDKEKGKVSNFVKSIEKELVSHNEFQNIHCMTEEERESNKLIGPYELLNKVKGFIEIDMKDLGFEGYMSIDEKPYKLHRAIAIGYYILVCIIDILSTQKN
jgi:DNA (cytosine-5)-methyltransferase 1